MGAIVTNKRISPGMETRPKEFRWKHLFSGGAFQTQQLDASANANLLQETTGYRSSGQVDYSKVETGRDYFAAILAELDRTGNNRYDTGHPFHTINRKLVFSHPFVVINGWSGTRFEGPIMPSFYGTDSNAWTTVPSMNTGYYGPLAIKNTIPSNPESSLTNFLVELKRDGSPDFNPISGFGNSIRKSSSKFTGPSQIINMMQGLAGDYLNFQFAILPFISDLEKLLRAVIDSERILQQLFRDSGRNVRRRFSFPEAQSVTYSYSENDAQLSQWFNFSGAACFFKGNTGAPNLNIYSRGRGETTVKVTESYRFSGAYTYLLEQDDSILGKARLYAQLAQKLIGFGLTPEALWNATPWTWLADWFVNIGDNLSNASAFQTDGLVIRYGYLTRHYVQVLTSTLTGLEFYDRTPGPISASYVVYDKQRVKATPFGFGSNPDSWTDRQWAILASLGMTKSPRVAF